jgi:8-oxo-dGTP pyrophosphatase MutT (NUDIX family)
VPDRPPFVRLDETTAWEGRRLTIRRRRYRGPDGGEFEREFAQHPGAVGVIAVDEDERVVLVRQFRVPMEDWVLEMPAGTRDVEGEAPEETARRELAEEVGVHADHWQLLAALPVSPGVTDQVTRVYLATGLSQGETARDGPEERAMIVERVALSEILARVAGGELMDAPTVAGVALARLVLDARAG